MVNFMMALAVLRFTSNSNRAGRSIGGLAGRLRINVRVGADSAQAHELQLRTSSGSHLGCCSAEGIYRASSRAWHPFRRAESPTVLASLIDAADFTCFANARSFFAHSSQPCEVSYVLEWKPLRSLLAIFSRTLRTSRGAPTGIARTGRSFLSTAHPRPRLYRSPNPGHPSGRAVARNAAPSGNGPGGRRRAPCGRP